MALALHLRRALAAASTSASLLRPGSSAASRSLPLGPLVPPLPRPHLPGAAAGFRSTAAAAARGGDYGGGVDDGKISPDEILFEGCDYNHWLITMEFPDPKPSREDMMETYLQTLAKVVGRYPAINKPVGVVHWLNHSPEADNVDWVVILDADQIVRGPIIPWELGAEKGKPVAAYYGYLKGCDNILAQLHTAHPEFCDKVGGLLAMHIDDLRALAPLWLSKTEEVRQDKSHWSTNITGDIWHGLDQ